MEGWPLVAFTSLLSLAVAIVVGFITAILSRKSDKQKAVHAKRIELYLEFYEIIDGLLNNRENVFEREYFGSLVEYKAKIKLLASEDTYDACEAFFNFVRSEIHEYEKYCKDNDPYNAPGAVQTNINEDDEEETYCYVTEMDEEAFECNKKIFKEEHLPSVAAVREYISPLFDSMRNDLKSKI